MIVKIGIWVMTEGSNGQQFTFTNIFIKGTTKDFQNKGYMLNKKNTRFMQNKGFTNIFVICIIEFIARIYMLKDK